MADAIRKVIKKVRHKFKPPQKLETPLQRLIVQIKADQYQREFWERDKKVVREMNFDKALKARALQIEAINAEKQRQADVVENRLKNLKKARRKLAKIRSLQNE